MSDTLIDTDEVLLRRFSCSCGSIQHIMDISVEAMGEYVVATFSELYETSRLWRRAKLAYRMLLGRRSVLHEFILGQDDLLSAASTLTHFQVKAAMRRAKEYAGVCDLGEDGCSGFADARSCSAQQSDGIG